MQYSHYVDVKNCPDSMLSGILAEFRDNGVSSMVFTDYWAERMLKDPRFMAVVKRASASKVKFGDMHAPYGECFDLACLNNGRRADMIADHIRSLGYASDLGCRTYTVHIGAWDCVWSKTPNEVLRPLVIDALEKIIPAAEKYGVVLALENAFEPANTPDEVMYYVDHFKHPYVGCCFDCGHANIMEFVPGKMYPSDMIDLVWNGKIENYNGAFEKMAPAMVTCHLHDNNGLSDQHRMPGNGTVRWDMLSEKLLNHAPQLLSIQSEVGIFAAEMSISSLVKKFRDIFPDWQ